MNTHYDEEYYQWQKKIGEFGGKANTFKFLGSVGKNDTVIDFGCGGGFLLQQLDCRRKIGIEPNISAHQQIAENGVECFASQDELLEQLGGEVADVIISNNALEHTLNPLQEIKSLLPILKKGGRINFIVPCDSISLKWKPKNINNHLFSWSPMNLGNLFTEAGYIVESVAPYKHKWPKSHRKLQRLFGWRVFNIICRIYARLERSWYQVQILARKP